MIYNNFNNNCNNIIIYEYIYIIYQNPTEEKPLVNIYYRCTVDIML